MASILGINDFHYRSLLDLLRFLKFKSTDCVKTVKRCFEDVYSTKLAGDVNVFTVDEVNDIVQELENSVSLEVDLELVGASHITILLLTQLYQQAEKWQLRLVTDTSELENKALLEKIKAFDTSFDKFGENMRLKIEPLAGDRAKSNLLQYEVSRLQTENAELKEKLYGSSLTLPPENSTPSAKMMEETLADYFTPKNELENVNEMLQLSNRELEKRVAETIPFKNLKQILLRKNEQLKDLRKQLQNYETNVKTD